MLHTEHNVNKLSNSELKKKTNNNNGRNNHNYCDCVNSGVHHGPQLYNTGSDLIGERHGWRHGSSGLGDAASRALRPDPRSRHRRQLPVVRRDAPEVDARDVPWRLLCRHRRRGYAGVVRRRRSVHRILQQRRRPVDAARLVLQVRARFACLIHAMRCLVVRRPFEDLHPWDCRWVGCVRTQFLNYSYLALRRCARATGAWSAAGYVLRQRQPRDAPPLVLQVGGPFSQARVWADLNTEIRSTNIQLDTTPLVLQVRSSLRFPDLGTDHTECVASCVPQEFVGQTNCGRFCSQDYEMYFLGQHVVSLIPVLRTGDIVLGRQVDLPPEWASRCLFHVPG